MRTSLVLAALIAAAPLAAQHNHGQGHGAGHAHHGNHAAPEGWTFRLDRANADRSAVHFMQVGDELHFRLGPSGIFYHPENLRSGAYTVSAEFQQMRAPQHPEAFGLVIAGQRLDAADQDYMYFLVRGTGEFTVKHRAGDEVHTIADWTAHDAIRRQGEDGRATNTLSVEVDPQQIRYLVNGTQVYRIDRASAGHPINTDGVYGIRVNHNLDVHVKDLQATGR